MATNKEEFAEFVLNHQHAGRVRLCVEFNIKPDKIDEFKTEFQKCIDISVKERGCAQVGSLSKLTD